MRYVLISIAAIVALVLVIAIAGWRLPVHHRATGSVVVPAAPDVVFDLITRVDDYPRWRTGVKRVERMDSGGVVKFREHGPDGEILFAITDQQRPSRVVTRIADPSLPFGGTWTYEIVAAPTGSELRITEDGEVYNPIFRFVARYIMGPTRTIDRYLADVSRRIPPPVPQSS